MADKKGNLPLYRRWRSQNFKEIVGQDHVVKTIKNAIVSGRIAQAYLFCGPRGTGKTSMARILAKALNCLDLSSDGEPCNKCSACVSINQGSFLDVIEMDAASHTQVDKIREFIVEKVNFRPAKAKRKIYIIDEVHKLSAFAFDALLKTIEEPPPFVVFILATTEPDKLPPTILSRCQRFDFRRIPVNLIVDRLKEISEYEGFCIEEGALNLIAQASDGALRDALVILDQAISFSDECVTAGDVIDLLGMTLQESLFAFADAILQKDTEAGLRFVDDMYRRGKDLSRLVVDLLDHFRKLLLIRLMKDAREILELTPSIYTKLSGQAFKFKRIHLMSIIRELIELKKNIKEGGMERLLWDMTVIRLTQWESSLSVEGLHRRLLRLEKALQGGKLEVIPKPQVPKEEGRALKTGSEDVKLPAGEVLQSFLQRVKREKFPLIPILKETKMVVDGNALVLKVDSNHSFNRKTLEDHRKYLQDVLQDVSGGKLRLKLEVANIGHLFDKEKPHKVFVQEVMDVFEATPVDSEKGQKSS